MEKIVEQGILYDFYGPLLTEHQQEIYEACVYEDLSLSEAAERFGISRQGVHDLLRRCDRILKSYEDRLGLIGRFREQQQCLEAMQKLLTQRQADGGMLLGREEADSLLADVDRLLDSL
ncbi:MAG: DNA-binding protein [Lachnospiraceae bacterium]|nr:DNA-binding protein [Lachnospiraceae bacterium]